MYTILPHASAGRQRRPPGDGGQGERAVVPGGHRQLGPRLRREEPARRLHQRRQARRLDQGHRGGGAQSQGAHGVDGGLVTE